MHTTWGSEQFDIDLNGVRDGNRALALLAADRPQRVPVVGEGAVAVDEDGNAYDATVEAVRPGRLVYLRVNWSTKRLCPTVLWR